ncbi:phosphoribosylformylglycinamidine synthase I [Desulfofarcimen acetoxidans DSM 771]|uniref:Phosphoribosylformylglycinamidine synthase subunit PurQ n=1 Tax=Desulfofarcimen acetoxidans (strain ATCC 49208 / DSM 771 / KCTC 5769 / VKM B-1644 / 5575) TaxID=485916 RepID=C8W0C7_DESAS|nr:phosphoribosylformylglycinamidine synthase I [Desulfofarcimen acetoxidans]ACV63182.1 phosphoribosylformylglycinamidine synthase I [Desulfofarcimen acetoxidans DSM 771]
MKPRVCILRTDGTNCDLETYHAFEITGANCRLVHVNQLRNGEQSLSEYQILAVPGGFSYGDDIHSGKVLAVELTSFLKEQMLQFINSDKLILGICNGFQVLVRTGLLPFKNLGNIDAALMENDSGRFECRWVNMGIEKTKCVFTEGMEGKVVNLPAAHGEGKFFSDIDKLKIIESNRQVVFRYVQEAGAVTADYPANPNGSLNSIAGICDDTGRILGLMPHPERFVKLTQHPNWRRLKKGEADGLAIFHNAVKYFQAN